MTAPTHYAFSCLLCTLVGIPAHIALPASLMALLPDIDHPDSLVGRLVPALSRHLLARHGHRTITHSLPAIGAVLLLAIPLLFIRTSFHPASTIYAALVIAFTSHIFIDLFNKSGAKLLYPFSNREYISFHSLMLRIRVASWQEYLFLAVLVTITLLISGQTYSLSRTVRGISKLFYRHYDGAVTDYRAGADHVCLATVEYFNHSSSRMVKEKLRVLDMYPEKAYFLRSAASGPERVVLKKDEIIEIEILVKPEMLQRTQIQGSSLSELARIPAGSFVSGEIIVHNYRVDLRNTEYLRLEHTPTRSVITLIAATPAELVDIVNIERARRYEIDALKSRVPEYQIQRLEAESRRVKDRMNQLKHRGFYANYREITRLNGELKKIESRIDTLNMQAAAGADAETRIRIEQMEKEFRVEANVQVDDNGII